MKKAQARREEGGPEPRPARKASAERRRLAQLAVSLAVFCAVFFGRGFLPGGVDALRQAIAADTDFQAVFADLGRSLTRPGLPDGGAGPEESALPPPPPEPQPAAEEADVWSVEESGAGPAEEPEAVEAPEAGAPEEPEAAEEPEAGPPEPTSYPYDGPAAPARATMAYDPLGLEGTVLPLAGRQTDVYGWRSHPITGEENFHHGLDLAAPTGTPVLAFADGVVEFVGEGDSYGKYVQVKHSDHVSTLYAHCSQLLLPKGTAVKAGEPVALVGDTGMATGPHLHFEVKVDGVWHDPVYYLELP